MKIKHIYVILASIIILQVFYLFFVFSYIKQGYHSDEVWNYGYANSHYSKELTHTNDGESLLNQWTDSQRFRDYISVDSKHRFSYSAVIYNTSYDLNPPLQYLILHTISSFFPGKFSWYFCFAINIIAFIVTQICIFVLLNKMTNDNHIVSLAGILLYGFGMGATNITIFMRIYALGVMFVALFALFSYGIYAAARENKKIRITQIVSLFVSLFLGAYTVHLFLLVAFCVVLLYCIYFLIIKRYRILLQYGFTCLGSAVLSILVFPSIFSHVGGSVDSHSYGIAKYPTLMQLRYYWYLLTKDLFGIRISPFPNPYLEWFLIGLVCLIVLILPVIFVFRKDERFHRFLKAIRNRAFSILKKWKNFEFTIIVYLGSIITLVVIASMRTSVYHMGVYASRYIFLIYPITVMAAVIIFYYLLLLISEKKKITSILILVMCLGCMVWTHLYKYHTEYFFIRNTKGISVRDIEKDSNSVIVLSYPWLLVCFAPDLFDSNAYYATNYWEMDAGDVLDGIDRSKPFYLILDQSYIVPDEKTKEGLKEDPVFQKAVDLAFYEEEFLDKFYKCGGIKNIEFVGKDSYMKREFKIYRFEFQD